MNEATLNGQIVVPGNRATGREGMSSRRQGRYEQFLRNEVHEDAALLRAKISRDTRILEAGDPKQISRKERAEIERQVKLDAEWVKKKMCPQRLFHVPRVRPDGMPHPDFGRAVEACKREHTEEYKAIANRLKENLRRLDPDNDSNLERFRPKS